jgi:putative transposase
MTNSMMNLRTLVEQAPDSDILRDMISFAAERLMEREVSAATGAPHGREGSHRRHSGSLYPGHIDPLG